MKILVRQVSPVDVREELLGLLERNLGVNQAKDFEWRYTMNPAGPPSCWFAYEGNSDTAIAMTSLFRRNMYVDGKLMACGQVTHFVIDARYRSLGPALLLQRATFEPVDSGALAFCYDCPPHDQGMSTFVRLGMRANCEVARYALLLRSDAHFEKRIGKRGWTKPLVATTNLLLNIRARARPVPGLEICEHGGTFGEEFSALDRLISSAGAVRAGRSAEELDWRYTQDPVTANGTLNGEGEYRVLVARRGGELVAYLVIHLVQSDGIAYIVDLFGSPILDLGAPLLEAAITICRQRQLHSVYGFCSKQSELDSLYRTAGFLQREMSARVVAYENPGKRVGVMNSGLRWPFGQFEVTLCR